MTLETIFSKGDQVIEQLSNDELNMLNGGVGSGSGSASCTSGSKCTSGGGCSKGGGCDAGGTVKADDGPCGW